MFIQYDSSKLLTDTTAYQTFTPPPMGMGLGATYGWCTAVSDDTFIYWVPVTNSVNGSSGNILRFNFQSGTFSNYPGGGVPTGWDHFDMTTIGTDWAQNATNFQSAAYDQNRFVYYIPFKKTWIVRYDTWNGGTGPDPSGFTVATNYTKFDPTTLGSAGPAVAGLGQASNLVGFTGGCCLGRGRPERVAVPCPMVRIVRCDQ